MWPNSYLQWTEFWMSKQTDFFFLMIQKHHEQVNQKIIIYEICLIFLLFTENMKNSDSVNSQRIKQEIISLSCSSLSLCIFFTRVIIYPGVKSASLKSHTNFHSVKREKSSFIRLEIIFYSNSANQFYSKLHE